MIEQDNRKRYRHNEDLLFEELNAAVETIDAVAQATGKTFNQVSSVYRSQAINRLTEILIDAGDDFDWKMDDIKTFISEQMSYHREWYYDNQPLKIEIEKDWRNGFVGLKKRKFAASFPIEILFNGLCKIQRDGVKRIIIEVLIIVK